MRVGFILSRVPRSTTKSIATTFSLAEQGIPKANPCVNDSTTSSSLVKIYLTVQLLGCHGKCKAFSQCHFVAKQLREERGPSKCTELTSDQLHWPLYAKLEFGIESRTKLSLLMPPSDFILQASTEIWPRQPGCCWWYLMTQRGL